MYSVNPVICSYIAHVEQQVSLAVAVSGVNAVEADINRKYYIY